MGKANVKKNPKSEEHKQKNALIEYIYIYIYIYGITRWRSWLRHCATSRKVAGSIPDGAIEIFH